jgi:hypothetical protein
MKRYDRVARNILISTMPVLFIAGHALAQKSNSDVLYRELTPSDLPFARPFNGSAHLIIKRFPNLGNHVIANLWIDGITAGPLGYGHTFEGYLRPGRHIVSVLPSPNANWRTPWEMILDVRSRATYYFTARSGHSGEIILEGGLAPTRAHYD